MAGPTRLVPRAGAWASRCAAPAAAAGRSAATRQPRQQGMAGAGADSRLDPAAAARPYASTRRPPPARAYRSRLDPAAAARPCLPRAHARAARTRSPLTGCAP